MARTNVSKYVVFHVRRKERWNLWRVMCQRVKTNGEKDLKMDQFIVVRLRERLLLSFTVLLPSVISFLSKDLNYIQTNALHDLDLIWAMNPPKVTISHSLVCPLP
jgi:hypothetical protein